MLKLEQLVHGRVELIRADTLLIIRKKSIYFLDFLVHLLGFRDCFHDFDKTCELDASVLRAVMLLNELLYFVVRQVNVEASEEIL